MRCPVCKAENFQGPQCRRCKADLSLLFALEDQHRHNLAQARNCLRRGDWEEALEHAEAADWLRSDEGTQRLMSLAYLLGRDFPAAWQCYQKWRTVHQGNATEPS